MSSSNQPNSPPSNNWRTSRDMSPNGGNSRGRSPQPRRSDRFASPSKRGSFRSPDRSGPSSRYDGGGRSDRGDSGRYSSRRGESPSYRRENRFQSRYHSRSRSPRRDGSSSFSRRSPAAHRRSRSPPRRYSRSPPRRYSRSPRRYSRSPPRRSYRDQNSGYSQRPRRAGIVERGTEEQRSQSRTLFIGNIPYDYSDREVNEMLKSDGTLVKVSVPVDRGTGKNKGFCFVEFESREDAEKALNKYHGLTVVDRRLKVDWDIGVTQKTHLRPRDEGYSRDGDEGRSSRSQQEVSPMDTQPTAVAAPAAPPSHSNAVAENNEPGWD